MAIEDELTRWALGVEVPKSKQVGADRVRVVLIAFVQYVDKDLVAWPSAATLAADVPGISRWDVRNALALLESAGLIVAVSPKRKGVLTKWRVVLMRDEDVAGMPSPNMVGVPATPETGNQAGMPTTNLNQNQNQNRRPPLRYL